MLKEIANKYYFEGNYNCAETVVRAANEYYHLGLHDIDMILVGAQGGGLQCGEICGALNGACSVLSVLFVEAKAHECPALRNVIIEMIRNFRTALDGTQCKELKANHFQQENRCLKTVHVACDILEEVVEKYKDNRVR